jgi:hypothetical protein
MKDMKQTSATLEPRNHGDDEFRRAITGLATEVENLPRPEVLLVARRIGRRHWYWTVGLLAAAVVGGSMFILAQLHSAALRSSSAGDLLPPPAVVIASFDQNPCAQRMARIIRAVSAYSARHGAPPDTLAQLIPGFLSEPAVDPVSGRQYGYERKGEAVVLVCPHPEGHTPEKSTAPPS